MVNLSRPLEKNKQQQEKLSFGMSCIMARVTKIIYVCMSVWKVSTEIAFVFLRCHMNYSWYIFVKLLHQNSFCTCLSWNSFCTCLSWILTTVVMRDRSISLLLRLTAHEHFVKAHLKHLPYHSYGIYNRARLNHTLKSQGGRLASAIACTLMPHTMAYVSRRMD